MDRSHLICAQCQWSWPFQTRISYFEGQALESVACPKCQALALKVMSVKASHKRFQPFAAKTQPLVAKAV